MRFAAQDYVAASIADLQEARIRNFIRPAIRRALIQIVTELGEQYTFIVRVPPVTARHHEIAAVRLFDAAGAGHLF